MHQLDGPPMKLETKRNLIIAISVLIAVVLILRAAVNIERLWR